MKALIFDTVIIIAAALGDETALKILEKFPESGFTWAISRDLIYEYKTMLRREKFGLKEDEIKKWLDKIRSRSLMIEVNSSPGFSQDPGDARIIALAESSGAVYCITRDKKLLRAGKPKTCKFLLPENFLEILAK